MRSWFVRGFLQALLCPGLLQAAYGAVIVVTTTADSGAGSLRWAIQMTLAPGPDSIRFAIPLSDAGHNVSQGTWTIRPLSSLPAFTDGQTTVDGTSQAKFIGGDSNPNGPEIEINAELISDLPLFCVLAPEVTVRGLTLNMSKYSAIMFDGVQGGAVYGCYIGTTSDGMTAAGNSFGVGIHNRSRNIVIGDVRKPENGNLISGNQAGVFINGSCAKVSIIGNRIGTNRTGSDTLGGQEGGIAVYEYCDSVAIFDNLIGGNSFGIILSRSTHTFIETNFIGTDDGWAHNLGNTVFGILVADSAHDNWIGNNVIANNHVAGIQVSGDGTVRNCLFRNLISGNGQKGIRIEGGGNDELQAPTILSVTESSVSGTAGPGNTIEVYGDSLSQGRYFLGEVYAGADGAFAFSLVTPIASRFVTATATNAAGNTSEFSPPHPSGTVAGRLVVTTTADTGTGSLRWAIENSLRPGPDSICFAIPVSDPGHDAVNGTWTIRPKTPFRVLTDGPLVIDGQSQAGFIGGDPNPYGPEIEINGADLSQVPALAITGSDVQVAALTINRCKSAAVMFQATLRGKLLGCYLGTTPDGMAAAGNEYGVWILQKARDIMVGDASDPQVGNLLSGNETGVLVTDSCRNVRIGGNRIGVKRTGTDSLGNTVAGIGVQVGSDSTTISGNRIGGKGTGIYVSGSTRCSIYGNSIGTDTAGAHRLGKFSQGVFFDYYARDNVAASNVIANCVRAGIMVFGSGCVRDRLTMNRIFGIAGKAIETSFGGNVGVQKPSILSVSLTSVTGTTFPGASIEVFADDSMQARHFCGSTKANASGGFVLQLPHTISWRYVTATATDSAGNTSELSAPFVLTDVNGEPVTEVPADFRLERNYPNPFNPNTVVSYQLPVASQVKLVVYDLLGREVAVLVDAQMPAGEYRATFHGALQASGIYVVRLKAGAFTASRKMLLAK